MNVLITGGSGLLGSNLISYLNQKKYKIFVLDKNLTKKKIKKKITFLKVNFENIKYVSQVIKTYKINTIFHLGAQTQVLKGIENPYQTLMTNVVGTLNFLETIRKLNKKIIFIYSSSDKAYGEANLKGYKENTTLGGVYPYDVSKSASDLICQSYAKTYNLKVGIIRCANIFGPGDKNLKRIVPETIISLIKNKPIVIRSNGNSIRNYIFVEDVCEAYELLMKKMLKTNKSLFIYNIGSKINFSVKQIILRISKIYGTKININILNNSKKEIFFQKLNYSSALKNLKWKPKTSFDKGIKKTIDYYKKILKNF